MLLVPAHCHCIWLYLVLPTPCTPFIMLDALMFACSLFCIPVAPSSMLFMCLLLRAVFNFGWLPDVCLQFVLYSCCSFLHAAHVSAVACCF